MNDQDLFPSFNFKSSELNTIQNNEIKIIKKSLYKRIKRNSVHSFIIMIQI